MAGSASMGVDRAVTVGAASSSRKADIYLQRRKKKKFTIAIAS